MKDFSGSKELPAYVGRFAPSPSGPLHFGSLVCALASYLDAKSHLGKWLVRIDDIDPPREQQGATAKILSSLKQHGLLWDDEVFYQSKQSHRYQQLIARLNEQGITYPCYCTRKRLSALNTSYDNHCRTGGTEKEQPASIRLNLEIGSKFNTKARPQVTFNDSIQGRQVEDITQDGDFIIHRKDGYFAYQLAVVADDIYQGITHIVRGVDLLPTTAKQIYLTELLDGQRPDYTHIPVVINAKGDKLSKQNHAAAICDETAKDNLLNACIALNLRPPESIKLAPIESILTWATSVWNCHTLRGLTTVPESRFSHVTD